MWKQKYLSRQKHFKHKTPHKVNFAIRSCCGFALQPILTQHRHICWQTTYLYSSLFLVTTDSVLFLLCDLFCKQPSLVSQSFGHSKSFMKILKSFLCFQWTTSNTHIYVGNQGGWIKLRINLSRIFIVEVAKTIGISSSLIFIFAAVFTSGE